MAVQWKRGEKMNFNNKKTKRLVAIGVIIIVVAMVVTTVLPAMTF